MILLKESYNQLIEFGEQNAKRRFSVPAFTNQLRSLIGSEDIKLFTKRDADLDKNSLVVSGYYDPFEDQINCPSINIFLTYSKKQKTVKIADLDWNAVAISLVECVGHEHIHQEQYRERDFDIGSDFFVSAKQDKTEKEEQEYLGSKDEIEAYGYSIAAEIYLKDSNSILCGKSVAQSAFYKTYSNVFGPNHIVVRQLLEHVFKYYRRIQTTGG